MACPARAWLPIALFLAASGFGPWAVAADGPRQPVVMLIVDTPLDYFHEDIAPALDLDALKTIQARGRSGPVSLYELNLIARVSLIASHQPVNLIKHLQHAEWFGASWSSPDGNYMRLLLKALQNLPPRSAVANGSEYFHGTHVAGIAIQAAGGPDHIKIVNLPSMPVPVAANVRFVLKPKRRGLPEMDVDEMRTRTAFQLMFGQISRVIRESKAGVANLSFGVNLANFEAMAQDFATARESVRSKYPYKDGVKYLIKVVQDATPQSIKQAAAKVAAIYNEELAELYRRNPNCVFVVATGNQAWSQGEATKRMSSVMVKAPNVVRVVNTLPDGSLAPSSTYGTDFEVAAVGTDVASARAGLGGQMRNTGTSMSSPSVAGGIAALRGEHPELTSEEAIQQFLETRTEVRSNLLLGKQVAGGRFFPFVPDRDPDRSSTSLEDPALLAARRKATALEQTSMTDIVTRILRGDRQLAAALIASKVTPQGFAATLDQAVVALRQSEADESSSGNCDMGEVLKALTQGKP